MMRIGNLRAFVTIVLSLTGAGAAAAATANFQGNCTTVQAGVSVSCTFSPQRAPAGQSFTGCNGNGVSSYDWNFGDGSSTSTSSANGVVSHTYYEPYFDTVTLTVHCNGGANPTATWYVSNYVGGAGIINPDQGWMPF